MVQVFFFIIVVPISSNFFSFFLSYTQPMEIIMTNLPQTEFQTRVRNRAMLYGPASAIHLQMDRAILSAVQRLPMLPSDRVGLECVLNQDNTMEYSDFLGDPALDVATTAVKMTVADICEAGLGY